MQLLSLELEEIQQNSSGKTQEHFCYITDRGKGKQKKKDSKTVRWRHKPEFPQIYYEWNKSWQRGKKEIAHTHTKDRATESAFHEELFIKTTWVNNPLLSPQTRHISTALSVGKEIWKKTERMSEYVQPNNRGNSAWKREFVAEWNSQNSWHTQNSLFQLRKSFPGRAAATLGLITRALFRLQTPSSDEKYVSC